MPVTLSFPGVYIEEIPSGVRTITGVATSITAFIGRALYGPVDEPVTIQSLADFERGFGGLWIGSTLGFAVRDFYQNGGAQAIIVRLYRAELGAGAKPARAELTAKGPAADAKGLDLVAASPGAWGNNLRARVDADVSEDLAQGFGLSKVDLFNLTVRDTRTGREEQFRNLSVKESPRRVDRVLANGSALVRAKSPPGEGAPVPTAHDAPAAGKDIWEDDKASSPVPDDKRASDGQLLGQDEFIGTGKAAAKSGLFALEKADLFNLLCIPPYKADGNVDAALVGAAAKYCEERRALLLVDPQSGWDDKNDAKSGVGTVGTRSKNAALYFPRLRQPNPLRNNQIEDFAP